MYINKFIWPIVIVLSLSGCNIERGSNRSIDNTPPASTIQTPQFSTTQTLTMGSTPSPFPVNVEKEIETFLQTNGNCRFPCFWGIYPETTSNTQVDSLFNKLDKKAFVSDEGDHTYMSTTLAFRENGRVYLKLDIQNSVVRNTQATLDGLWNQDIQLQDWSAYNLDEILKTYGTPTSIGLYLDLSNNLILYSIRLTYSELDTMILYESGKADEENRTSSEVTVCPSSEISSVKMNLGKKPINPEPNGIPLSKATNLDVDSFYHLFTEDPSACFTINLPAMGW